MSTTPHLALPLLAAAQAQKHVTHNEALAALDALVHLSVKERGRNNPPATPTEGDRYLVGSAGIGDVRRPQWTKLPCSISGSGGSFQPSPGWRAYVEADETIVVFNGMLWRDVAGDVAIFDQLGIGTQPDAQNPLAAKLNSALFTAEGERPRAEPAICASSSTKRHPAMFCRNSTRAAIAVGPKPASSAMTISVFAFRPDGNEWRDALRVDSATGMVSFPSGMPDASGNNCSSIAASSSISAPMRAAALTAGVYGYDRWKSGAAASTMSRLADGTHR